MRTRPGRFTVDDLPDLSDLPDWGMRREVLDGRLVLTPPQSRRHDRVIGNLAARFWQALPRGAEVRGDFAIRLPDGDGPVPDVMVTAAPAAPEQPLPARPGALAATDVATVVEVVAADGRFIDRVWKQRRYAEAGIPCYWRVELEPWPGYRGPLPVIVVRVRERAGWREIVGPGGRLHALPLAHRRRPDGTAETVPLRLDPESLTVRHATTW
jgi:Uma2 family endonuclease